MLQLVIGIQTGNSEIIYSVDFFISAVCISLDLAPRFVRKIWKVVIFVLHTFKFWFFEPTEEFSKYGPLVAIDIKKGFGFVQVSTNENI